MREARNLQTRVIWDSRLSETTCCDSRVTLKLKLWQRLSSSSGCRAPSRSTSSTLKAQR